MKASEKKIKRGSRGEFRYYFLNLTLSLCIFITVLWVGLFFYEKTQLNLGPYQIRDRNLLSSILKKVGHFRELEEHPLFFIKFPPQKKAGTLRIGTFGDSHTAGSEVDDLNDYPAQLLEKFQQHFPQKKIEVLNFGQGGHGFQQTFMIWQEYAKAYQIDYVLLGPRGFYPIRDLIYTPFWDRSLSHAPRSRYILAKDNGLRLIQVRGNSLSQIRKNYYSFFPEWQVWKYDKNPFKVWQYHFSFLDNIKNPFYYSDLSVEEESFRINKILLEKIKKEYSKRLLFMTSFNETNRIYKDFVAQFISSRESGLYWVFGHESSLGNEVLAEFYFNALIGKKEFYLDLFRCQRKEQETSRFASPKFVLSQKKRPDQFIREVLVKSGNSLLAEMILNRSDHYHYEAKQEGLFRKNLLAFFNRSFLDAVYMPLNFSLSSDHKMFIKTKDIKLLLGPIESLDESGLLFGFQGNYVSVNRHDDSKYVYFKAESFLNYLRQENKEHMFYLLKKEQLEGATLQVSDQKVARLHLRGNKFLVKFNEAVTQNEKGFLIVGSGRRLRHRDLKEKLDLSLEVKYVDGRSINSSMPNWLCKKERKKIQLRMSDIEPIK